MAKPSHALPDIVTMTSAALARNYADIKARNPLNLPYRDLPHLTGWNWQAAIFEAEGRAAYPHGRNPYNAGVMAAERWAAGWHHAEAADIAREAYERAAVRVRNMDWRVSEDGRTLAGGWIVAGTYSPLTTGRDFYVRKAFADWYAPAEHRNDGMRVTETAAEKGVREGPEAVAKALLEFAALPDLAIRLLEAR